MMTNTLHHPEYPKCHLYVLSTVFLCYPIPEVRTYAVDIDDFKADMNWTLAASNIANAQASRRSTIALIFVLAIESWCICLLRFKGRTGNSHDLSTALVCHGSSTGGLSHR